MSKKAQLTMFVIMNIAMAVAMSLSASLLHDGITATTAGLCLVGFAIGMLLSFLIPYGRIGAFMVSKVKSNNIILKALASSIVPAVVNTVVISAVMTLINVPLSIGFQGILISYFSDLWKLLIVGIVVATPMDKVAFFAAMKIDSKGETEE